MELLFRKKLEKMLDLKNLNALKNIERLVEVFASHGCSLALVVQSVLYESGMCKTSTHKNHLVIVNNLLYPENDLPKLFIARYFEIKGKISHAASLYAQGMAFFVFCWH